EDGIRDFHVTGVQTCALPISKVEVGGFASLKVAEINRVGLFLDWGLPKELLLPHSEEKRPLQVGDYCVVHVYLDPRTRRITATRSEEHTSELQSRENLVCRLL